MMQKMGDQKGGWVKQNRGGDSSSSILEMSNSRDSTISATNNAFWTLLSFGLLSFELHATP
ncbi:hypothetical protein Scep_016306 [Stephania cephalantha]|uniref:Uncharacterized protein n=1 Tax=Stephania cephalantha TaxID=152367 RepID=A0AAP0IMD9_9MAGN